VLNGDDLCAVIIVLLKAMEFDVYEKYAEDILHENGRTTLNALLQNSDAIITLEVNPDEYFTNLFVLFKVNYSFNSNPNLQTSKAPLETLLQGTRLFTSTVLNQRGCPKDSSWKV